MQIELTIITSALQTIIISMVVFFMQRKQKQRDKKTEERAEARKKESLLSLNMNMASAKLSYAVAVSIKQGKTNGEIEAGIKAYEETKKEYLEFLNEQATDHLQ